MWIGGALSRIHSVAARYQTSDFGSAATGMPASATARHRLEKTPRMTAKNAIRPYSSLRSRRAWLAEMRENAVYLSNARHHGGEFGPTDAAVITAHALSSTSRTARESLRPAAHLRSPCRGSPPDATPRRQPVRAA